MSLIPGAAFQNLGNANSKRSKGKPKKLGVEKTESSACQGRVSQHATTGISVNTGDADTVQFSVA